MRRPRRRRLQEQLAQVANEDIDRVLFGALGHFAADLALQAGHDQPRERIADAVANELAVRMAGKDQKVLGLAEHRLDVGLDLHADGMRPLAAVDRQHAMRRHATERLDVVVIVLERVLADDLLFLLLFLLQIHRGQRRGAPARRARRGGRRGGRRLQSVAAAASGAVGGLGEAGMRNLEFRFGVGELTSAIRRMVGAAGTQSSIGGFVRRRSIGTEWSARYSGGRVLSRQSASLPARSPWSRRHFVGSTGS